MLGGKVMKKSTSLVLVLLLLLATACSGPAERKAKFYEKGVKLYNQEELVEARV